MTRVAASKPSAARRAIRKDARSYIASKAATTASLRRAVALSRELDLRSVAARQRLEAQLFAAVAAAILPHEQRAAA